MPKKRVIVTKSACKTNINPRKKNQHLQNDHALYRVIC